MGQDAATPPGLFDRIRQMIRDEVAKLLRSGLLRSASIGDGGLTIRGGFLRLLSKTIGGVEQFYIGPVTPDAADGSPQQGLRLRRADGTQVLSLRDAFPADSGGALNQALNWYDRLGNVVLADDTNSGQGIARPNLSGGFARVKFVDMTVRTTSATFETLWSARITKQQPRLEVWYRASMDTAATTGEVRVLVNGVQLGSTETHGFGVGTIMKGPEAVDGAHMSTMIVEIQGRRVSASGALAVEAAAWFGRQS